jgi:hypothetical protein
MIGLAGASLRAFATGGKQPPRRSAMPGMTRSLIVA